MSTPPLVLNPARTALINVHWQNDIVTHEGAFATFFADQVDKHGVIDAARRLVNDFRAVGSLVVWSRAAFQPGYPELILNTGLNKAIKQLGALIDGSTGADIIPELTVRAGEPVVSHPGTSGFPDTALDSILRRREIDTVVFTGVSTNVTVEGTARDAVNLGYHVVLVSDACTADTDAAHEATLSTFGLLGQASTAAEIAVALSQT
ncbi:cysteine hydrolase family protein [Rhodococcus sp. NPDC057297]|uniref:cysteine hydrolase family protein n=1 Tax=Rhodococcus sp. NPDC057297 TaxID=3346090 RepID=UPI00362E471A